MKQLAYILLLFIIVSTGGCTVIDKDNPYDDQLHTLQVNAVYPDEYSNYLREGISVKIEDIDRGNSYTSKTDKNGTVRFNLTKGIYRILISDKADRDIFNGLADKVKLVNGDLTLNLPLVHSRSGAIIIKEIYCGGCTKLPFEGNYQSDKYMILHNNTSETQYLDSLCFGSLDPYNSQATNVWITQDESTGATIFPDFLPVAQCVWQFGGTGPLITGQRVIDTMFPLAKGGAAAIPGGFGTGKTMTQHQIAKWCDADIIIYVGCGERGNEMTQALQEFSELVDPRTGKSLMDRTVLIANTSNMPVAAREASIYTGITLAEYYRDMGYHAAMMADSTSRWAEALREISGRLEEMPADEGYPAYLPSRLAEFYERAGYVKTLNGAEGSVSVIGAVSPQGNDFSEPVTQNTKRFTRCFWALDKSLAYARHYPAINWNDSYSEYLGDLGGWYYDNVGHDFMSCRERIANLLLQENNLMQIVKLIGSDVLPDDQKLTIEIARVIRVGFLQQNAFHAVDTYVPLEKQLKMMETILYLYDKCAALVAKQVPVSRLLATGLFDELVQMKYTVPNDDFAKLDELHKQIDQKLAAVAQG